MGKITARRTRKSKTGDPVVDQLAVIDARSMLFTNMLGMGWRLALTVLVPIFIGVQLDKKFDSAPSITLAAFFLAIFAAGVMIAKVYNQISAEQALEDAKEAKREAKKRKRVKNV